MSKILKQVTLDSVTRRKDKTISLRFTTSLEQTSEQLMELDKVCDSPGVIYYKAHGEISEQEAEAIDQTDLKVKEKGSQSQKLRSALYVLWSKTESGKTQEQFYNDYMNKFRLHITDQIPND